MINPFLTPNPHIYNIEIKHTKDSDYRLYAETISQHFAESQAIRLAKNSDLYSDGLPPYCVRVVRASTGEVIILMANNHKGPTI